MEKHPYVITVSSEKGGVGKTTLATNLAVYLKALAEDLPVSILSLDNHFTIDRMFSIKGQKPSGDVTDLLMETPGHQLLTTGQYGVNYIASSTCLDDLRDSVRGTMVLNRLMALSEIPGILIIDTRPELNIFTQNALYAADKVIVPVKDMPSLENCRNIFDLFERKGMDKKSLSILPCLIDARIKYNGPFKDHKSLLRAFAINRGYHCLDGYISKSPKVESLNTNPEGKVYPILTHARGTDVYGQYAQLAQDILAEYQGTKEPRSYLFHQWMVAEDQRKREDYEQRLSRLKDTCILCDGLVSTESSNDISFYYEASDGGSCGFLEDRCCHGFLLSHLYDARKNLPDDDPLLLMFRESARESVFTFRPFANGQGLQVEIQRLTPDGATVSKKVHPLREYDEGGFTRTRNQLFAFLSETLGSGTSGTMRDAFLIVHPTPPRRPLAILSEDMYRRMVRTMRLIAERIGMETHLTSLDA